MSGMIDTHSYHIITNTESPPLPKHGCQGNTIYVKYDRDTLRPHNKQHIIPPLPKHGRQGNKIYVRYDSWYNAVKETRFLSGIITGLTSSLFYTT